MLSRKFRVLLHVAVSCMLLALLASAYADVGSGTKKKIFAKFGQEGLDAFERLDGITPFAEVDFKETISERTRVQMFQWFKNEAVSLSNRSIKLYKTGNAAQAIPYSIEALELSRLVLSDQHPAVVKNMRFLSELYKLNKDYDKVEAIYDELIIIYEEKYGADSPRVATMLNKLANLYSTIGKRDRIEDLYKKSLAIFRSAYGNEDKNVVSVLFNLALLYDSMGRMADAEPAFKEATALAAKVYGPRHASVAHGLNNLALLYYSSGKFDEVEPLYKRALDIYSEVYGTDHPAVSTAMNNLALLYTSTGKFAEAEIYYKEAISIDEKLYGKDHQNVMSDLNNLATLYKELGEFEKAEPLFLRALKIARKSSEKKTPALAANLNNIGMVYYQTGKIAKAEPYLVEALEVGIETLGPEYPDVAAWKSNLALLYASLGKYSESHSLFRDTMAIELNKREDVFTFLPEKQKLQYMKRTEGAIHAFITLAAERMKDDSEAVSEVLDSWLMWKGAVMETQQRYMDAINDSDNPAVKKNYQDLMKVRKKLAKLRLVGSKDMGIERYNKISNRLETRKQAVESALSRLSRDFALEKMLGKASTERIASLLPEDSVYIDYAYFRSFDFETRKPGDYKYYAFIVAPGEKTSVSIIELAPPEKINLRISGYLGEIRSLTVFGELPRKKILREDAGALYSMLIEPMKEFLEGRKSLFISPSGNLNLIPFEVFTSPEGKYLIEDFQISYITAGRDIMRFTSEVTPDKTALIIADPDYDLKTSMMSVAKESTDSAITDEVGVMNFVRLKDTATEADEISKILTEKYGYKVTTLTRENALEERLFEADSPRILHLATHAYFLKDVESAEYRNGVGEKVETLNPMHRSGIVLAGANESLKNRKDFGIVSAYKALGLKLSGTDLVVLSACDTGTGEVQRGEGVFGLRRAFIIAGAKTLVMSLWSVPSAETTRLMIDFYDSISQDRSKAESLREAKLSMIAEGYNPFYWGAFVLAGNPG